jgi:hypothetical protein
MTLHLRPGLIVAALVLLVAVLSLAGWWAGSERNLAPAPGWFAAQLSLFDLACENNVPTWFSSALLMAAGAVAFVLGAGTGRNRGRWWLLAATLAGISLAEDASLLERSLAVYQHVDGFGLPFASWRWIAVGGACLVAVWFVPLLGTLSPRRALLAIGAALLFCVGHWAFAWWGGSLAGIHGGHVAGVVLARVAEETSKLLGETAGIAVLLGELQARGGVQVRLG